MEKIKTASITEKILKIIFLSVGLFIIGAFLYSAFYSTLKEKEFVENIEKELNASLTNYVLVKDVTPFDWDVVCAVHRYISDDLSYNKKEALEAYGDFREVIENNIPFAFWPSFYGAYFFIKEDRLVNRYVWNSYGLRFKEGAWNSEMLMIVVDNEKIAFLTGINFENDRCIERSNAIFYIKGQNAKYILLDDIINIKEGR